MSTIPPDAIYLGAAALGLSPSLLCISVHESLDSCNGSRPPGDVRRAEALPDVVSVVQGFAFLSIFTCRTALGADHSCTLRTKGGLQRSRLKISLIFPVSHVGCICTLPCWTMYGIPILSPRDSSKSISISRVDSGCHFMLRPSNPAGLSWEPRGNAWDPRHRDAGH